MKQLLAALCLSAPLAAMETQLKSKAEQKAVKQSVFAKHIEELHPLIAAAYHNHLETLKELLALEVDVDTQEGQFGTTALYQAVKKGHHKAAEMLLKNNFSEYSEKGADPNIPDSNGLTPLMVASHNNDCVLAKLLLTYGANIFAAAEKVEGISALHVTAKRGHKEMVELLLTAGADIDCVDNNQRTPLIHAASKGHMNIMQTLCEKKAATNIVDTQGRTALHYACLQKNTQAALIMLFLDFDTEKGLQDNSGSTPLHYAAVTNKVAVVENMLSVEYPLDCVTKNSETALFFACAFGHPEVVQLLLSYNADTRIAKNGITPYAIALQNGHKKVAALFKNGTDA